MMVWKPYTKSTGVGKMVYCNGWLQATKEKIAHAHGKVDIPSMCVFRDIDGKDYCVDCYKRRYPFQFGLDWRNELTESFQDTLNREEAERDAKSRNREKEALYQLQHER